MQNSCRLQPVVIYVVDRYKLDRNLIYCVNIIIILRLYRVKGCESSPASSVTGTDNSNKINYFLIILYGLSLYLSIDNKR